MFPNRIILNKLVKIAEQSECKHKMSCIITDKKDSIISYSPNSNKSHPYQCKLAGMVGLKQKIYLHSEIGAICKISNSKKAYRIYIIRVTPHGFGMALPCPICRMAIEKTNIREIVYSINYNQFMVENI